MLNSVTYFDSMWSSEQFLFKMASSYMELSIFDPILAHRSFETMFPQGRSPLLFKVADVTKTVHLVRG